MCQTSGRAVGAVKPNSLLNVYTIRSYNLFVVTHFVSGKPRPCLPPPHKFQILSSSFALSPEIVFVDWMCAFFLWSLTFNFCFLLIVLGHFRNFSLRTFRALLTTAMNTLMIPRKVGTWASFCADQLTFRTYRIFFNVICWLLSEQNSFQTDAKLSLFGQRTSTWWSSRGVIRRRELQWNSVCTYAA